MRENSPVLPYGRKSLRHVLSVSGGKDSAALAIYMRDRVPEMEYIFHDTDKELPETYDYVARLEAILGKPIVKTSPVDTFDHWLAVYGGMLPSNNRRWCTKMLKLKPFEAYVGDRSVINYVGLRADEKRVGYISPNRTSRRYTLSAKTGSFAPTSFAFLRTRDSGLPPTWHGVDRAPDVTSVSISRRSNGSGSGRRTATSSTRRRSMKKKAFSTASSSTGARMRLLPNSSALNGCGR